MLHYPLFKTHPDFPNYIVSSEGHVISKKQKKLRWLKPAKKFRNGRLWYLSLTLWRKGYRLTMSVHAIVADCFLDARPTLDHVIRHLDGNPANNSYMNLCWGTPYENSQDRIMHGTAAKKLTPEIVLEIRELAKDYTYKSVAESLSKKYGFKITRHSVRAVYHRRSWKHV